MNISTPTSMNTSTTMSIHTNMSTMQGKKGMTISIRRLTMVSTNMSIRSMRRNLISIRTDMLSEP